MYLSLTKTKFQKRGGWDMKKSWLLGVLMLLAVLPVGAQQVMYSNLKELVENRGDTVTTLKIEKRCRLSYYGRRQSRSLPLFEVPLLCCTGRYLALCQLP